MYDMNFDVNKWSDCEFANLLDNNILKSLLGIEAKRFIAHNAKTYKVQNQKEKHKQLPSKDTSNTKKKMQDKVCDGGYAHCLAV